MKQLKIKNYETIERLCHALRGVKNSPLLKVSGVIVGGEKKLTMFTFNDDTATTTTEHFSVGWDWVLDKKSGCEAVGLSDSQTEEFIVNLVKFYKEGKNETA